VDTPTADQELLAPLHDARESHPELAHTANLPEEIAYTRRKIEASAPNLPVGQQEEERGDDGSSGPTVACCGRPGQVGAPSALTPKKRPAPATSATLGCIASRKVSAGHGTRSSSTEGHRLSNPLLPLQCLVSVGTDVSAREEGCR
jgi:hypothetical protein